MNYDHRQIEAKWQKFWKENQTYRASNEAKKPKYYVLDMFPYPSGAGLHVGHLMGYTATDILARYKRANGFNVLHPMGWDSFGLPAEQYAIRTGTHPALSTQKNIDNFRRQLYSLGFSYDWDRELATSDPKYYRWTQWIFTLLYQKGLAYEAEMLVNFCPALGTVLSNEEVDNGRSKEGGHAVERRPLRQWILKITAYAERLIQDLELVDWPESLKKLQINWIGKSEGAFVHFQEKITGEKMTVFTTRPDTLFGATYLVLAPEHFLVDRFTTSDQKLSVEAYKKTAANKSDLDRTELNLQKSGVFTGAYAINPVNSQELPIWISDYVMMGYGTGCIMAVPSHDKRDFDFAKKFHLPLISVYDPIQEPLETRLAVEKGFECWTEEGILVNSQYKELSLNGLSVDEGKKHILDWLQKNQKGEAVTTYKLRDWLFSRQRYWGEPFPILKLADGTVRVLQQDELPLLPPEVLNYKPTSEGHSPLAQVSDWVNIQDSKTGQAAQRETNVMPQWAGSCWYYLRFCDPHNDQQAWSLEAEKYWMPVDMYVGGVEHAVLHLMYARFWHKVLYDCGFVHTLEPFKTLRNQGLIVARSYHTESRVYIEAEQVEEKGGEYFYKKTGEKLISQIEKMSKSKLNGVTPDEIIQELGADSLRLYEMFMGPLEKEKIWNTEAVLGCRRFLNRFYDMVFSNKISDQESEEALRLGHRLVHGVTNDLETLQFNTAIAKMMEFMNYFVKLAFYPRQVVKMAIQMLAPFAPHLAEEAWAHLSFKESLSYLPFPSVDLAYLEEQVVTYVVQINGKLRGRFDLPKDQTQEIVLAAARKISNVATHLEGKTIEKVIFVPNKLLNLVIN